MTELQPSESPDAEPQSQPAEVVKEVLEKIAGAFEVSATVEVEEDAEEIRAAYAGADVGALIGHHGQTIDAIQHIAFRMAYPGAARRKRVQVDAAGYRARRASGLESAADQAAEAAVREGRPVLLEAMSAAERRLVHEHLKERHDVETYSQGEEPDRRLVVAPVVG